ncbi:peptidase S24/S26A/S26B/S26C, partial [Ochromonadaceae sp. CCMP2298]
QPRYIPSGSMAPTLQVGDKVLVDIITHRMPLARANKPNKPYQRRGAGGGGGSEALIKRVVGVAGDLVEVRDRRLYVNGQLQQESYTAELPDYSLAATTVPKGMLLVLGDNRNNSFDGHVWGLLPEGNVRGRAVCRYTPIYTHLHPMYTPIYTHLHPMYTPIYTHLHPMYNPI